MDYYYIYNLKQALFFIKNDVIPIDIGIGKKKEVYHKFIKDDKFININKRWQEHQKEE